MSEAPTRTQADRDKDLERAFRVESGALESLKKNYLERLREVEGELTKLNAEIREYYSRR